MTAILFKWRDVKESGLDAPRGGSPSENSRCCDCAVRMAGTGFFGAPNGGNSLSSVLSASDSELRALLYPNSRALLLVATDRADSKIESLTEGNDLGQVERISVKRVTVTARTPAVVNADVSAEIIIVVLGLGW